MIRRIINTTLALLLAFSQVTLFATPVFASSYSAELISLGTGGVYPDARSASNWKSLSENKQFVGFGSNSSNLIPGFVPPTRINDPSTIVNQVYVHDRTSEQTILISQNNSGEAANDEAHFKVISDSGQLVLFDTTSTNMGNTSGLFRTECYLRDVQQGTTTLLVPDASTSITSGCWGMSSDDNIIGITTAPNYNWPGYICPQSPCQQTMTNSAYLLNRATGVFTPVAMDINGNYGYVRPTNGLWTNFQVGRVTMSDDAGVVSFWAANSKLIDPALDEGSRNLFVRNMTTNEVQMLQGPNQAADNGNTYAVVSGDGSKVVYTSTDTDLTYPNWSNTGQYRLFVRDLVTGTDTRVDVTPTGNPSDGQVYQQPSISDDGRYIAFISTATNLTPEGSDNTQNVYVRDMQTGVTKRVDINSNGDQANGAGGPIQVLNDGSVQFNTYSTNMDPAGVPTGQVYFSDPWAPSVPENLSAASPTNATNLTWDLVDGADSYNVYRDGQNIDSSTTNSYVDTTAADGSHDYYVTAVNSSGESDPSNTVNVIVDASDPTITHTLSPLANTLGWHNGDVTVTYDCADVLTLVVSCTGPVTVSSEGANQQVAGTAVDEAGNTATDTVTLNIDKTNPTVTTNPDVAPNVNGWNNTDVTVSFDCNDALSGVQTCTSPVTVSTEGASQLVSGVATDNADNSAGTSTTLNIDKTAPTLTTPTWSTNPIVQGTSSTVSAQASDALSGASSVVYSVDGGTPQLMTYVSPSDTWQATFGDTLLAGTYMIDVTAYDNAGNTTTYTDVLAVYNPSNGYVTGHGNTYPTASDTLPIALDTSNNPAKLVLGFSSNGGNLASTSFDMDYTVKNKKDQFTVNSTNIDWVVVQDGEHASIQGTADLTTWVNGVESTTSGVTIQFHITLGTNGASDHVLVEIYNPGVNPSMGTPMYVIDDDVLANGSNLRIHQ